MAYGIYIYNINKNLISTYGIPIPSHPRLGRHGVRLPDLPAEIRDLLGAGHHVAGRPAGEDAVHLPAESRGTTGNHGEPRGNHGKNGESMGKIRKPKGKMKKSWDVLGKCC